MKHVVITGSSGLVATELIHTLIQNTDYCISAISSKPSAISDLYPKDRVNCMTLDELKDATTKNQSGNIQPIDIIINCAFSRSGDGHDIATSLDYLRDLITLAKSTNIKSFINISSQSVYGQKEKPFWTEETPVAPNYLYAVGKYASEVITKTAFQNTDINYTNVRLSSVAENARFLNIFAKNALTGTPIKVFGGAQTTSFIDVRDVADGLMTLLKWSDNIRFEDAYNLGTGTKVSVMELAEIMAVVAKEHYGLDCTIIQEESDIAQDVGMDITRFTEMFSWKPKYDYADMCLSLLNLNKILENDGSGGGE